MRRLTSRIRRRRQVRHQTDLAVLAGLPPILEFDAITGTEQAIPFPAIDYSNLGTAATACNDNSCDA